MIRFRCRCNEPFEVPAELAGSSFQCPACGLLVDVPTLDDLPGLDAAGYKLHETPIEFAEPTPVRKFVGAGTDSPSIAARHDMSDRRMSLSDFLKIGTSEDDLLQLKGEVKPGIPEHPKYDPVTGELVVPLEVRRDEKKIAAAIPIAAAPAVLGYERHTPGEVEHGIWWPWFEMWRLPNLIVVAVVTAMACLTVIAGGALWTFFFPVALILPLGAMVIAHFANIIEETGPSRVDEVPRPLRGGGLMDDFVKPLFQILGAYFIAWLPLILALRYAPATRNPEFIFAAMTAGVTIVPALLITFITSGALNNVVPHRALSVIGAAGRDYWACVVLGELATFSFLFAMLLCLNIGDNINRLMFSPTAAARVFKPKSITGVPLSIEAAVTPLAMLVAVYLVHVFCWQMGLIYRRHHDAFSWVLQKHESTRTDTLAQLHSHRQRELESKAAQARQNMEVRIARGSMPVAKPVQRQG